MPINLRARPIEGVITDNAGSVLRNATITIKDSAPNGDFVVTSCKSDGDGYFITDPVKNGVYDVYESGVRVFRVYHSAQPTQLQCYSPSTPNVPSALPTFASYLINPVAALPNINAFKFYLQLEPESIDTIRFGNCFPLEGVDPTTALTLHPFERINQIHTGISSTSRLTHTRFDVEYFNPLLRSNSSHHRIRWAGIPGIKFSSSSKVVLGLDYYGIIPKQRSQYLENGTPVTMTAIMNTADTSSMTMELRIYPTTNTSVQAFSNAVYGDIVKVVLTNNKVFLGIYYLGSTPATDYKSMQLRMWQSSNTTHVAQSITSAISLDLPGSHSDPSMVSNISLYNGMFSGIETLNQSVSERFFVVENVSAQNIYDGLTVADTELFNYSRA